MNDSLAMEEIKPRHNIGEVESGGGSVERAARLDDVIETPARYKLEHKVKIQFIFEGAYNAVHPGTPGQCRQVHSLCISFRRVFLIDQFHTIFGEDFHGE
jgi:hypothetical protein